MGSNEDSIAQRRMSEAAVDKTWHIPAHEGKGPVTMTLRLPEVTITDSEGRHIVISPQQSSLVGSRMTDIADWLGYGDEEWTSAD